MKGVFMVNASLSNYAWVVHFFDGDVGGGDKTFNNYFVTAVRGGSWAWLFGHLSI